MQLKRFTHAALLCVGALVIATGCRTLSHPPERVWPYDTPGSYPGRTEATKHGEWWFPSQIGPKTIPPEGGNKGTIFYLGQAREKPAAEPGERAVRVVYNRVFEPRDILAERLIFPDIVFAQGSAALSDLAQHQMRQAAAAIERARGYNVVVEGHIDAGEPAGTLDARRAEVVLAGLIELGAPPSRLSTVALGSSAPLSQQDTPFGHALNRRVAFRMVPASLELYPTGPEDDPVPQVGPGVEVVTVTKTVVVPQPNLVFVDRLVFPNILFDYDRSNLRPESRERVDRAAVAIRALDNVARVTVEGHCDWIGSHEYNDPLSQRRATAVRSRLIERDVPAAMVDAVGHGKRQPIASNETSEGRQLNRRVEFRVEYAK